MPRKVKDSPLSQLYESWFAPFAVCLFCCGMLVCFIFISVPGLLLPVSSLVCDGKVDVRRTKRYPDVGGVHIEIAYICADSDGQERNVVAGTLLTAVLFTTLGALGFVAMHRFENRRNGFTDDSA